MRANTCKMSEITDLLSAKIAHGRPLQARIGAVSQQSTQAEVKGRVLFAAPARHAGSFLKDAPKP